MLKRVNRHWLRIVLVSQCAVGGIELLHYAHCDAEAFDCARFQWLFDYILNYPLSPLLESGLGELSATLATQQALLDQGLHFAAYVIVGTAWWTLLGHAAGVVLAKARGHNEGSPQ
jgi:hypothetical protein